MEVLIADVRRAVACEAWYAALGLALALPDICGSIDSASKRSQQRYVDWFDRFGADRFRGGIDRRTFLSGSDCYALRCAYLHEGDFDISDQRAKEALARFRFVVPPVGWTVHNNLINDVLQLQVANFCEQLCQAAEAWLADARTDPQRRSRLEALASIEVHQAGTPFTI